MRLSLTEGRVSVLLARFSMPFLLASMVQMGHALISVFFLNRLASPASVAGAWNGIMIGMTIGFLFTGVLSGGMILMGQLFGAGQHKKSATTMGNTILLQAFSIVASVTIILLFGRWFINILNVPAELDESGLSAAQEAWAFLRIFVIGVAFQNGYNALNSIQRTLGDSKRPMIFIAISCALNIVLDYIFIGPLQMGAAGAALGTIIAQLCGFLIALVYLLRKKLPFTFGKNDFRPDREIIPKILKLGMPISAQLVLNMLSFGIVGAIINNMGVFAAAASAIVNSIANFIGIIPMAFAAALGAISAQNLGAGKTDRALQSAKLGVLFSLAFTVPAVLIASLMPTAIVSLFSPDPDVIRAAAEFLVPFSWDFILISFVFCINSFFNGCGMTKFVAVHETIAALVIRVPVSWLLSRIPGATLFHVGIGTPVATLVSLILCLIFFRLKLSGGKLERLSIASGK